MKIREAGKAETVQRARNGQARSQYNVGDSAKHGVEGCFPILPAVPGFLITAEDKYRVVCARGDDQQREQINRVGRKSYYAVVAKKGDDSPGRG